MGSEKPDLGSGRPDLGSERPDLGSGRPDLRSEKPDLGPERSDLESKRPDLGSEGLYLRLGGTDGWTDGQTDGRKPEKIALCRIIGHRTLRGRCPKRFVFSLFDSCSRMDRWTNGTTKPLTELRVGN